MIECMGEVAFIMKHNGVIKHRVVSTSGIGELQNALRMGDCSAMTQWETIHAEG